MTIIGAYLGSHIWQSWSPDQAEAKLRRHKRYGINAIFAEATITAAIYSDRA